MAVDWSKVQSPLDRMKAKTRRHLEATCGDAGYMDAESVALRQATAERASRAEFLRSSFRLITVDGKYVGRV